MMGEIGRWDGPAAAPKKKIILPMESEQMLSGTSLSASVVKC